jgi:hypothetical protein
MLKSNKTESPNQIGAKEFERKDAKKRKQVGKELDPPVPPRYRNRVNSLYLPTSGFPAPGGPNSFTP